MAQKTAEQIVEKYQRGVSGASADYAAGVQNPSRPWAQATVQGAARWQSGIQQAIAEKRFERGVQAAGDAKWQQAAVNKGARNYSAAASDAAAAFAQKAQQVMASANAMRQAAQRLPNTTPEQREARMLEAVRAARAYWKGQAGR